MKTRRSNLKKNKKKTLKKKRKTLRGGLRPGRSRRRMAAFARKKRLRQGRNNNNSVSNDFQPLLEREQNEVNNMTSRNHVTLNQLEEFRINQNN